MLSAAKIFARWDEERATLDKPSHIVARTRGIPSGIAFTAQLECVDVGPAGSVEGMTSDDGLRIPVEDWDDIESVPFAGEIEADAPFPAVFFGATLVGAGRQIRIPNPIRYQDELTMQLVLETEDGPIPLDNERYVIATRWGRRPKPLVRVFRRGTKRVRGKTEIEQYGVIGVREAKPNEKPAAADVVGKDGSVEHQLQGDPYVHGVNSDLWVVTISSQPGGANVSFEVQVELPGTNPLVKGTTTSGPMGIARQQFNAAKPTVQRLLPGDFKRLVVGLNLAPTSPPPERINAASGTALLGSPTEPLRAALEDWAMTASELLTLSPYGSPGAVYALSEAKIVTAGLAPGKAEPFIHITSACQQLVSAALAARGVSFPPAKAGLNAGSAARDTWTKDLNGKWITAQGGVPSVQAPATFGDLTNLPDATMQQATTLFKIDELTEAKATLGLGAVFLYSNRKSRDDETHFIGGSVEYEVDPKRNTQSEWGIRKDGFLRDNTAGAHVGMVLRSDPRTKRFQLLDTGGCGAPGWGDGVSALQANKGFHGGIFEGPSCTQVGAGKDPLRGAGVFAKPADAGAEKKLADEISAHLKDVSKKARPLGLVRLVLLNPRFKVTLVNVARFREQNWLHYASPLLPMWEGDQDSGLNYSIARYLFSLRDLPGLPELNADSGTT